MSTFTTWFETDAEPYEEVFLAFVCMFGSFIIYLGLGTLFDYPFMWGLIAEVSPAGLLMITKNALGEEAVFRLIPFLAITSVVRNKKIANVIFLLICPIFAYLHYGVVSLIVLTPISFMLSVGYLKFGGATGKHLRAYLSVSMIHIIINLIIQSSAKYFT